MEQKLACPKCNTLEPPLLRNGLHECPKCGVFYEKVKAKPARQPDASQTMEKTEQSWAVWPIFLIPAVASGSVIAYFVGNQYSGFAYFWFYFSVLIVFLAALLIFRQVVTDSFFVRLVFLLGYESIGIARFIRGISHGIYNRYYYLSIPMFLGGVILFLIFSNYKGIGGRHKGGAGCDGGCSGCGGGCSGCGGE